MNINYTIDTTSPMMFSLAVVSLGFMLFELFLTIWEYGHLSRFRVFSTGVLLWAIFAFIFTLLFVVNGSMNRPMMLFVVPHTLGEWFIDHALLFIILPYWRQGKIPATQQKSIYAIHLLFVITIVIHFCVIHGILSMKVALISLSLQALFDVLIVILSAVTACLRRDNDTLRWLAITSAFQLLATLCTLILCASPTLGSILYLVMAGPGFHWSAWKVMKYLRWDVELMTLVA